MKKRSALTPQFYRLHDLKVRFGVSGSSIWSWVKQGTFPAPIKLSAKITAWEISVIEDWVQARIDFKREDTDANPVQRGLQDAKVS